MYLGRKFIGQRNDCSFQHHTSKWDKDAASDANLLRQGRGHEIGERLRDMTWNNHIRIECVRSPHGGAIPIENHSLFYQWNTTKNTRRVPGLLAYLRMMFGKKI